MKKALIVRLSSLGDVVLSSVLIEPLIKAGYKPYLLTFKPYHSLFEDDWRVTAIGTTKDELFNAGFIAELKRHNFELVVDVHKNLRTFKLRRKIGGRWLTYRKDALRRRLAVRFPRFRRPYSVTESYLGALGDMAKGALPLPQVLVSQERLERLKEVLPSGDFVALGAGARYRKKKYPYFRELARLFMENSFEVVWLGDETDAKELGDVEGINLCGKLGLADVLGVIKLATAFVGNDSGLLHCARAVRTPAVQIYGGTHPTFGFALYPEEGKFILKGLECQPCDVHGKGDCRWGDYRCLDIEPSVVFSETLRLVSARAGRL
ncbi:glycosyltransferase family 9 protein [Hydrogenivirga sp. 128-5-R1-1]|uniref:glycosyltransferase family 9 protein n=1 Tax=Hydrogenivirga sp. 128-5-R1-1 TaxID=392423 RepID=UPI00015EF74E|nr:glycosyltransferase family 9 protein [Hydrogenivirga sp. 128-5-R1-1]EDP75612.1 ADP-heptose:LPS heptosyltransferase [Hydrogenivirga sp. 128-5-R1-1]